MSREAQAATWSVLLIAGVSGTGKTTVAKAITRQRNITWVQVDDLRLAFQWSDVRLPTDTATDALYYFLRQPDVRYQPPERLRDALIAVGRAMADAIAIVVGNHVAQHDPVVIEGDGILPELLDHEEVRPHVANGAVRMVVVDPGSERELLRNMLTRGRGVAETGVTTEALTTARTNWLYAEWLREQADGSRIPLVPCRPWSSLATRVLKAIETSR